MVRTYKKKTTQGSNYSQQALRNALEAIKAGTSLRSSSKLFGIPTRTLARHRDGLVKNPGNIKLGRYENSLPYDVELALAEHVRDMSRRFYGMTAIEVRKLAFSIAKEQQISTNFNAKDEMAGIFWLNKFVKRHNLSIRSPQATNLARLVGFNKPRVDGFFEIYRDNLNKNKYSPSNIFNVDETGLTTVQNPGKVVAPKGEKTVGKVTSAERGELITAICCMSASGTHLPPMFVFPRKNMRSTLMEGAPPGSVGELSDKGWTNDDIFIKWLTHFKQFSRCSPENRCLIIVDGHGSHKTLAAINFCRENGIDLISLPPNTTNKLQPLDRTYFKSFKAAYNRNCDSWMMNNPGKKITIHNIASLAGAAYQKVSTPEIAISGFRCTGIVPYNPDIFDESDFVPSLVTDEPEPVDDAITTVAEMSEPPTAAETNEPTQSTSSSRDTVSTMSDIIARSSARTTSEIIKSLSPVPKIAGTRPRSRPSNPSKLLTSTPEKRFLEEKLLCQPMRATKAKKPLTKTAKKKFPLK